MPFLLLAKLSSVRPLPYVIVSTVALQMKAASQTIADLEQRLKGAEEALRRTTKDYILGESPLPAEHRTPLAVRCSSPVCASTSRLMCCACPPQRGSRRMRRRQRRWRSRHSWPRSGRQPRSAWQRSSSGQRRRLSGCGRAWRAVRARLCRCLLTLWGERGLPWFPSPFLAFFWYGGSELLLQGRCRRHLPPVRSAGGAGSLFHCPCRPWTPGWEMSSPPGAACRRWRRSCGSARTRC